MLCGKIFPLMIGNNIWFEEFSSRHLEVCNYSDHVKCRFYFKSCFPWFREIKDIFCLLNSVLGDSVGVLTDKTFMVPSVKIHAKRMVLKRLKNKTLTSFIK